MIKLKTGIAGTDFEHGPGDICDLEQYEKGLEGRLVASGQAEWEGAPPEGWDEDRDGFKGDPDPNAVVVDLLAEIKEAIKLLPKEAFTEKGTPRLKPLSEALERKVSAEERDQALAELEEEKEA